MAKSKKEIRKKFREAVFTRDGFRCKYCGYKPEDVEDELNAHHITDRNKMSGGGYVPENGITLCSVGDDCHLRAEKFHISGGEEWEEDMHPDDLYILIGSSYELAVEESKKLN